MVGCRRVQKITGPPVNGHSSTRRLNRSQSSHVYDTRSQRWTRLAAELADERLEHSFVTGEGKEAFYEAVVAAYQRRLKGDTSRFTWYEEWELTRLGDDDDAGDDEDGVWIIAATEARDMTESTAECVYGVLDDALEKFAKRRWAALHVIVLERRTFIREGLVTELTQTPGPDDLPEVDLVLFVDGDHIVQCYP